MDRIVIVGAGQAGLSLTAKLRGLGFAGRIVMIGEEAAPPYQRPPLSKAYLKQEIGAERLWLRPESFYAEQGIELHLTDTAVAIDRADRRVVAGGMAHPYDALALTTGAVPRRLPGSIGGDLDGVHVLRTLADVDEMAPAFRPGARLLVVGGGYIGLEVAAVAVALGLKVVLVEAAERILGRVAAPETAEFFRDLHRARIGVTPATELAEVAGLAVENGIAADAMGRTSDPAIWAAGDCASFPWRGGRIRLESVQNAIDQAECVAANMLGAEQPYAPVPWFWSDQYDVKLQIAGLNAGYERVVVRPGSHPGSRSHWYYWGGELLAVDAMNEPRAYMVAKRLIEAGKSPAPDTVADPGVDLKALL
ncbi:MAG: pyridine nucleotide-disulfide oxidoreductase [Alphaproteobacteria bacterium HGW-Alphaproteobacteria-2]|nr:MAG: pyridine nucleotide-disulfide oxidoreductase [Alphaproteobacteria bacterium HGW-Alphaproteobacteria-2]